MQIIQPHYHAIARTAQDYEKMAMSGVVCVCEPAFWAGFDRRYPETFIDYFRQICEFEPTRAAQYGIRHFCWVAVNPKEAENPGLTRDVLAQMPEFLQHPNCLGVGETGLHKSTKNEIESLQAHVEIAMKHNQLVLIHTPHLADKAHGTKTVLEVLAGMDVNPERIWIDHVEEHTVGACLDAGYWVGFTLYPITKCTPARAVDIIERHGAERLCVNSAGDWGPSKPTAVPDLILEMRRRGHAEQLIRQVVYDNPRTFFSQSGNFKLADPANRGGVASSSGR